MTAALYLAALVLSHPLPSCLTAFGQTACGYACAASGGEVKCAATPAGVCHGTASGVTCFDPPEGGWRHPQAACLVSEGVVACGYGCQAVGADVKCAQTPQGLCIADFGRVDCWDPVVAVAAGVEAPPAECLRDYGALACGWGCVADLGQVRCSQVPGGRCRADFGRLVCDGD